MLCYCTTFPGPFRGDFCSVEHAHARREGRVGSKLPQDPRRLGAPPSLRNMKYIRMHRFEKKSNIFSPVGLHENVWGPECFLGSHCGSRQGWRCLYLHVHVGLYMKVLHRCGCFYWIYQLICDAICEININSTL